MARIVLIEHNNTLRELLERRLLQAGHDVWSSCDVGAALAHVEAWPAEIGVIDLLVPGSDPLENVQRLHRSSVGPNLIAISGAAECPGYTWVAEHLGASHVLPKPFRATELVGLVTALANSIGLRIFSAA